MSRENSWTAVAERQSENYVCFPLFTKTEEEEEVAARRAIPLLHKGSQLRMQ